MNNADKRVALQVGERRFVTNRETLVRESGFFASLLSGRWDSNALEDGCYFIDADPSLFEHILRYLRRGLLPVFYNLARGHDHALYLALLAEARYFQIARLEKWLEERQYLSAVIERHSMVLLDIEQIDFPHKSVLPPGVGVEYYPQWGTKDVYICPRGIRAHRGSFASCGRACMKAQAETGAQYDKEPVLEGFMVHKEVILNHSACLSEGSE